LGGRVFDRGEVLTEKKGGVKLHEDWSRRKEN